MTRNEACVQYMHNEDRIIRAISGDGFVSISVITSRGIAERARNIHRASPVVTAALGRTLSATSLIGSALKKPDASVTVRINGGGPVGSIITVSDHEGYVRGYAANPSADLPLSGKGKLDVGGIVGKNGMLSVIKDFCETEPYSGAVELVTGEIAEDLAAYFASSEQTPTVCALGVLVDRDRSVLASGGYIVSLLPGSPEGMIDAIEKNVTETGAVTDVLRSHSVEELMEMVMSGFSPRIIETRLVGYRCGCSRDRILSAISGLDKSEIEDMKQKDEPVEVTCQFCDAVYVFAPHEIVESL